MTPADLLGRTKEREREEGGRLVLGTDSNSVGIVRVRGPRRGEGKMKRKKNSDRLSGGVFVGFFLRADAS